MSIFAINNQTMNFNPKKIEFKFFEENEDVLSFINFAKEMWDNTYLKLLDNQAVTYLFNKTHSPEKISEEFKDDSKFWIYIFCDDIKKGFMCLTLQDQSLFLSKIYLLPEAQGKGIFKVALEVAEKIAHLNKKISIRLNVNQNNSNAIKTYKKNGFEIIETLTIPIGNGYTMDDFIMEKNLI